MGNNPSSNITPVSPEVNTNKRPVEEVSWYDALVFCNRLSKNEGLSQVYSISETTDPETWIANNGGSIPDIDNTTWNAVTMVSGSTGYRLPESDQWEYACRAGTTTSYNIPVPNGSDTITKAVANLRQLSDGTYLGRTSEVGIYNTPNNWGLHDMHGNVWEWCQTLNGTSRVTRGGSWADYEAYAMSSYVGTDSPWHRWSLCGVRIVRP